jgi:GNAT superfamily N-acetyltransferase
VGVTGIMVEDVTSDPSSWPELVTLFEDYRSHYGQVRDRERAGAWLTGHLMSHRLKGYLALVHDETVEAPQPAGIAVTASSAASLALGSYWQLKDLFVVPSHRYKGVATALIDRVQADAVEHGALRLALQTETTNSSALALYRRHGFRPVEGFQQLLLDL